MLRAIRFASQLHFTIEPGTLQAIRDDAHRIGIVSQERITDELNKIIASEKPSLGFDLLFQTGLLQLIFPKMTELAGAEYVDGMGHKDNFYHTLQVLDNISKNTDDLWLRWAAILHDIGKPATKKFEKDHGWTFHGHEVVGGQDGPENFYKAEASPERKDAFCKKNGRTAPASHQPHQREYNGFGYSKIIIRCRRRYRFVDDFVRSRYHLEEQTKSKTLPGKFEMVRERLMEVEEKDRIRNWQPPITGEMIMEKFGLPPGKIVGDLKNAIREAILDGEISNSYDAAYDFMMSKAASFNLEPVK